MSKRQRTEGQLQAPSSSPANDVKDSNANVKVLADWCDDTLREVAEKYIHDGV